MFLFLRKEGFLKKTVFAGLALLLAAGLLFVGCDTDANETGALDGTWDAGFGAIIINTSSNTVIYEGNYEGKIANSPNYNAENGVLIIEFTKYWDNDYSNWPDVVSVEIDTNSGKFGALYWTELTSNSVFMADAYDNTTWDHAMFDTYREAQDAFTPVADKVGNYVDWSEGLAPYIKQ